MNICFTLPSAHIGGFRTFVLNLGRQFRKDGHRVSALIATRGYEKEELGSVDLLQEEMELHLCLQRRVIVRSRFLRKVIHTIEHINPDILIINHTLWPLATLPYLSSHIRRIIVVHSFEREELQLPRVNASWWDVAIAVGPGLYETLQKEWPRERLSFIPVGVEEPTLPVRQDFSNSPLQICYIGRLSQRQKNIFLIPDIAFKLMKKGVRFHWSVVGDGEEGLALERMVKEKGLSDFFTFFGSCDNYKTQHILSTNNILILPSLSESIGHVLQEAQMMGVVPIASRIASATDYVISDNEDGKLCVSDDADSFVNAVVEMNENRDKMMRLSENGKKNVRRRFEISMIAEQYYKLFDKVNNKNDRLTAAKKAFFGIYSVSSLLFPPRYKSIISVISRKFNL